MKKIIFLSFILLFLFIGCTQTELGQSSQDDLVEVTLKVVDENNQTIVFEQENFLIGTNAFDVMKNILGSKLKYKEYDFGIFVEEITKPAPQGYFFELFVNGQKSNLGISSYEIKNETIIEWRISKFEEN